MRHPDQYWSDALVSATTGCQLEHIVIYAPAAHPAKDQAAAQLLEIRPPQAAFLQQIVRHCSGAQSDEACERLLGRTHLTESVLRTIVSYGASRFSGLAAERLLEWEELEWVTLRAIIRHAPEPHKKAAWMRFDGDERSPDIELARIVRFGSESYRALAWKKLVSDDRWPSAEIAYVINLAPDEWKKTAIAEIVSRLDYESIQYAVRRIVSGKHDASVIWLAAALLKQESVPDKALFNIALRIPPGDEKDAIFERLMRDGDTLFMFMDAREKKALLAATPPAYQDRLRKIIAEKGRR